MNRQQRIPVNVSTNRQTTNDINNNIKLDYMRQILLLFTLIMISNHTWSQKYQDGGFKSLTDLKNNTPEYKVDFNISKRTMADIKAWGGNDYKIESADQTVTKKAIKKEIVGIVKNDSLYLNGIPIVGLIWYAKVEVLGKYCFLRPSFPVNRKIQKELGLNDPQYGYMFGAVGGAIQGSQMAVKRIPLIYNIETGNKWLLAESNILKILQEYPDLLADFEKESDKKNEDVLISYLVKVNALEE